MSVFGRAKETLMRLFKAPPPSPTGPDGHADVEQARREIAKVDQTVDKKLAEARQEGEAVTAWTIGIARAQHQAAKNILIGLADIENREIERRFGGVRPRPQQ